LVIDWKLGFGHWDLNFFIKKICMVTFIGIIGAGLVLLGFIMNQTKKWKNTDLIYDFVNFLGALLLVIYGLLLKGYPFVVLNTVWALVSLRDVLIDLKKK